MRKEIRGAALGILSLVLAGSIAYGCAEGTGRSGQGLPGAIPLPDTRASIPLAPESRTEHRAVMLQHLESVQQIVAALGQEEFETAQRLTETHLGFFMHRQAMLRQKPEDFPPAYHDLAMAHHEAAEELARVMPTKDLKQVLPKLDNLLKACVACHLEYKLGKNP